MSINLSKGQSINLQKVDGATYTAVRMGLGWDARVIEKKGLFGGIKKVQQDIDLDASAILIGGGQVLEFVYFGKLTSSDHSVQHTGDNRTGAGDGDDESILVHLPAVSPQVEHIVFVVNSYTGDTFDSIENAYVRVVDSVARDQEIARYTLTSQGNFTAMVMAKLDRAQGGWAFTAIGEPGQGKVAQELQQIALRHV